MTNQELKKQADFYGLENEQNQLIEEMGELIQAICKFKRFQKQTNGELTNPVTKTEEEIISNLAEEIADVELCTAKIKYLMDLEPQVESWKDKKISRQWQRIEKQKSK